MTRLRDWRPAAPPLPPDLQGMRQPGDPEWFARELAIAAAPQWWLWGFLLRWFSWVPATLGRIQVTGGIAAELRKGPLLLAVNHIGDFDTVVIGVALHVVAYPEGRIGLTPDGWPERGRTGLARMALSAGGLVPLRAGEPADRIAYGDDTRATTAVAAFPGGVVPDDIP